MAETRKLDLSLIVRDPELQPRETLDHDTIAQYAEGMRDDVSFPPVVVYYDGARFWLSQGFHRCEAAEQAGWTEIETEVREGTRGDAITDAAGSNKEFDATGRRRTNEDKRRAVRMVLGVHPDWSERKISEHVGVHHSTVARQRDALATDHSLDERISQIASSSDLAQGQVSQSDTEVEEIGEIEETGEVETPVLSVASSNGTQITDASVPDPVKIVIQDALDEDEPETESENIPIGSTSTAPQKQYHPTFNQTNEMVDWARWTWNPVTGCLHGCEYCYARDIANRFYEEKFEPTYKPERLPAPKNTKIPGAVAELTDPVEITAWKNVFVCSMADLFGRWVPDEWIEGVFQACRESPQWNWLFLSKFPNRFVDLDFPPNSWVGTSVDTQARVANAEKSFARFEAEVKWLSVEPMMERIKFNDLSVFDWVVIGGATRSTQTPTFYPEFDWVFDLIRDARDAGCKVYCKPNTDPDKAWSKLCQQYPAAFVNSTIVNKV